MTAQLPLTRRAALGFGLAASFLGNAASAANPDLARRKLVVIIARGAMDGLSATPPIGDPDYVRLRGEIAIPADAALRLDDTFALHPKLEHLHGLTAINAAEVVLEHEGDANPAFRVQIRLEVPGPRPHAGATRHTREAELRLHGPALHAEARENTLEAALLKATQDLEGQIKSHQLRHLEQGKSQLQMGGVANRWTGV